MKALVIGATGATGRDLVGVLLRDSNYTEVVAFVRRRGGPAHPKYSEIVADFEKLENVSDAVTGDVWFSCLGTTLKAAGSKEKQRHIDHDIPLRFAGIARRNGVPKAVIVSAHGASPTSRVFYSRLKGELDDAIAGLGFDSCIIFRPGPLLRKDTDRPGERITARLLEFFNALGILKKFRPLPTSVLAEKLARAPAVFPSGKHIVGLDDIFRL